MVIIGHCRVGSDEYLTFPYDRAVVDAIKHVVPASMRSYDPASREWCIAAQYLRALQAELRFCGGGRYQWFDTTPPRSPLRPPNLAAAFVDVFRLLPDGMRRPVEVALLQAVHPDHGGDHEVSVALNTALREVAA